MPLFLALLGALLGAGLLWLVAPLLFARSFAPWELGACAAALYVLFLAWHRHRTRRARRHAEGLRDSALW